MTFALKVLYLPPDRDSEASNERKKVKGKFILILLLPVLMSIPSRSVATVVITCADLGNGVIELSYDSSTEQVPVRAFALDVMVSSGIITGVGNFSSDYWVYPGEIDIIYDIYGEPMDLGSPVADPCWLPWDTLPGLGTSGMTIEMGALYVGEANAPASAGVLLTFIISAECDITVEENEGRGGVVLEDSNSASVYAPVLLGALPPEPCLYGGGSGTAGDPFLIFDANHLNAIGANLGDLYMCFKLTADIDLSGYSGTDFNIIGTFFGSAFTGVFEGNNHKIFNFTYTAADSNFVGLFGYVDGVNAEIKDLDIVNPDVNAGAGDNVGALIGYLRRGAVSRCSAQGGSVSGDNCVGGLVGRNYMGTLSDCYARTDVFGDANLGGLIGRTYVEVINSYSIGSVSDDANMTGGLAGFNHGSILSSFWDNETSGQIDGVGGTGESATTQVTGQPTLQMQTKSTFTSAGWDFKGETVNGTDDIWTICDAKTYPMHVRQRITGDFLGLDSVDMTDFEFFAAGWRTTPASQNWNQLRDISDPNDNVIDERDLAIFVQNWLAGM